MGAGVLALIVIGGHLVAQWLRFEGPWPETGELSSVAILAWYAWHNTTRVLPRLLRDERAAQTAAREQFRVELAAQREAFAAALAEARRQHLVELGMWFDQLACGRSPQAEPQPSHR